MASVLMVIAPDMFRDEEYAQPKEVLERRGAKVVTGSVAPGPARGKLGMHATAEVAIAEAEPDDFDAVVFVGGPGAEIYFDDQDAQELAQDMSDDGKLVAAICIAPSILAHAGLLSGKAATSFESREDDLVMHGARWTGADVEVDGHIVTANGPGAARAFGETIADMLDLP